MRWLIVIAVNLLLFSGTSVFAEDFGIDRFHADITVKEDASLLIREEITVEFFRPRHGIYREIPFRYRDEIGKITTMPLSIISVTDLSDNNWNFKVSAEGDVINIRIGDADKYVSGIQSYVITYQVDNALLFFEDHDEVYWNVTGNYWDAPIKEASADVYLAMENKSEELWASCYTGAYGSREKGCSYETSDNRGVFITTRALKPREGLTVAFGWQKNIITPPSSVRNLMWEINPAVNWVFLVPVFTLVFMISHWRRMGRDPKVRESVTVMYEPPAYNGIPLTAAEVGTLIDEKMDPRDITSSIIGLAVKGYLKIEETKEEGLLFDKTDYRISKLKEPDSKLSSFETELMKGVFSQGASGALVSDMKNEFYKNLEALKSALYTGLVNKGYFLKRPDKVVTFYVIAAIATGVATVLAGGAFYALFNIPAGAQNIFAGMLAGLSIVVFSKAMPAKTKAGAHAYMDIRGFQEFLSRAEGDKLKRMAGGPVDDKNLFTRFLPYAVALDVADKWAKAFEGIYQDQPEWYVSSRGIHSFSPYRFTSSLNAMTSSLGSAMFFSPRGSGSGGGGFSGGGGGGGGGGSW